MENMIFELFCSHATFMLFTFALQKMTKYKTKHSNIHETQ